MKAVLPILPTLATLAVLGLSAGAAGAAAPRRSVVVTHALLGAVVKDLAGDRLEVQVLMPNGIDPHEWAPSAKDAARLAHADLAVVNGAGLEASLERALAQARASGVPVFVATDAVDVRRVGAGEAADADAGHHEGHHHEVGAPDPHFWTDPLAMKAVARALAAELRTRFGLDVSGRLAELERGLDALDGEIRREVEAVPPARRKLVTGHESLGYFARRYGLRQIGAVVPGLSTEGESSAAALAALKKLVVREQVPVVFTEVGTPPRVADALARETGVRCVPLVTHALPPDGSYLSFLRQLAATVTGSLR
jgi:zinc/manganese transport system substrate-binding protein